MFAKSLKTALIVALISTAALPAFANGSRIHVQQSGWNNSVGGGQAGHRQRLTVIQNGSANVSVNTQDGRGNDAAVGQTGRNNSVDTDQWGRRNTTGVAQMGHNNSAVVGQSG
ncbi:MAG: hypothetical protein ACK4GT_21305, partial [Pararhodobacter sp.]